MYELIYHAQHTASELANRWEPSHTYTICHLSLSSEDMVLPYCFPLSLSLTFQHTHTHTSQSVEEMWVYINAPNYLGLHFSGRCITSDLASYIFSSDTPLVLPHPPCR